MMAAAAPDASTDANYLTGKLMAAIVAVGDVGISGRRSISLDDAN